jgi:hypothetical protein
MAYRQRTETAAATQSIVTDDPDFLRVLVERVVQAVLEAEMTAHLHAEPYERSSERRGYRNGYKPRILNTRVGTLSLQVPQDWDGTFSTQLFARYQRNEKTLVLALIEMYLEGVFTRKVREITEAHCGTTFSKSLVSELAGQLDTELDAWRNRPLTETTSPYLSVDARYEHVRQGGQIVSQGVLIVAGVRADGHREILAVAVADTESEATYHQLFRDLKARGLNGVRLVTSDDHRGLKEAIDRHFQGAAWQRCQAHVARDLVNLVGAGRCASKRWRRPRRWPHGGNHRTRMSHACSKKGSRSASPVWPSPWCNVPASASRRLAATGDGVVHGTIRGMGERATRSRNSLTACRCLSRLHWDNVMAQVCSWERFVKHGYLQSMVRYLHSGDPRCGNGTCGRMRTNHEEGWRTWQALRVPVDARTIPCSTDRSRHLLPRCAGGGYRPRR